MMEKRLWLPARVALLIGSSLFQGIEAASAQSGDATNPTLGLIIRIEPKEPKGALKVQQAKGVAPVNAAEGMLIRKGHMLNLDPIAKATVICGDGKRRELAPGRQGSPCKTPCTPEVCGIRYDGSTIGATRGPDTDAGLFPVVIAPRTTMLLNLRPTIRWARIAGANDSTTYRVTLYGEGMKAIWAKEAVSETRLAYPEKEPSLTPGQIYKVVVTSNGLSSEQDHSPDLGFTTLTADQARALADEEIKRKQLGLPATQTRFLVSNLFAARELYCESIEQLLDLNTTMKESAVVRTLGDLYAKIGLNREAEKKYQEALSLTSTGDLEGRGATHRSLAQVHEHLGSVEKAIVQLQEATAAYRRLENARMVRALLIDQRRLQSRRP